MPPDWREPMIPSRIELPLDTAISDLKKYKKEIPSNLYGLSSRHVTYLKRILSIIEGMSVPEKISEQEEKEKRK